MKKMLGYLGVFMALASVSFADAKNGRYVTIGCDLADQNPIEVVKIELLALQEFQGTTVPAPVKPGLTVYFSDGRQEFLTPVAKKDVFGKPVFTKEISFENGKLFFPGSKLGDIYTSYECYYSPDIPSPFRCQSQGSHEYFKYSRVDLNLGGVTLNLLGKDICTRTVVEY